MAAWLRLSEAEHIGRTSAARLLRAVPDPEVLLQLPPARLIDILEAGGAEPNATLRGALAAWQRQARPELAARVAALAAWSAEPGHTLLTLSDPAYPARLRALPDPPLLLYLHGAPALLAQRAVAIVGSRRASAGGMATAQRIAAELAEAGLCIVSGLAQGIDGAAHRGALAAGGATVAVLGTGIDRCYPARHHGLMGAIAGAGCLVSEYPLGTGPQGLNFPQRNRVISVLADAVLVVEAAARSGSLITAELALEQGREVLAVPGAIQSPLAAGCHRLIKQGAALAEGAQDVLDALGMSGARAARPAPTPSGLRLDGRSRQLLDALGAAAAPAELLAEALGWPLGEVQARLLALELAEIIERQPGGLFQLLKDS
nr:DNA-processing protein DprA [Massilia sp. TS11]